MKPSIAFLRVSNAKHWNHETFWTTWLSTCRHAQLFYVKNTNISRFSPKMVEAMVEVFHHSRLHYDFDYHHFFSDSCLPIASCSSFELYLSAHSPSSFVSYPVSSQWVTLHRNFQDYMTPSRYNSFECSSQRCHVLRNGINVAPDEAAFSDVSKHVQTMPYTLTFVDWSYHQDGHPRTFHTHKSWLHVRNKTRRHFFARKFHTNFLWTQGRMLV